MASTCGDSHDFCLVHMSQVLDFVLEWGLQGKGTQRVLFLFPRSPSFVLIQTGFLNLKVEGGEHSVEIFMSQTQSSQLNVAEKTKSLKKRDATLTKKTGNSIVYGHKHFRHQSIKP